MKQLTNFAILTITACSIQANVCAAPAAKHSRYIQHQQDSTQQFINKASLSGQAELQLGQLALKRAQNPLVKTFAAMIVKDHRAANAELKTLAGSKNIRLPQLNISNNTPVALRNPSASKGKGNADNMEINAKMNKLIKSPGKQFDNEFLQIMIADHQKAISLFEQGAKSTDAGIKDFAAKYLPALKKHLQQATSLNSKIESSKPKPD